MRIIIILLALLSHKVYAGGPGPCGPHCDEDASVYVFKQATPKFPGNYSSEQKYGTVRFRLEEINKSGRLQKNKKITLIDIEPKDVPKEIVMKMLRDTEYKISLRDGPFMACIETYELQMKFELPQKRENKLDITIKPEIKINQ